MATVRVSINCEKKRRASFIKKLRFERTPANSFIVGDSRMTPDEGAGLAVKIRTILAEHGMRVRNEDDW